MSEKDNIVGIMKQNYTKHADPLTTGLTARANRLSHISSTGELDSGGLSD